MVGSVDESGSDVSGGSFTGGGGFEVQPVVRGILRIEIFTQGTPGR